MLFLVIVMFSIILAIGICFLSAYFIYLAFYDKSLTALVVGIAGSLGGTASLYLSIFLLTSPTVPAV